MDHRHFSNSYRILSDQGYDITHLTAEQSSIHMGRAVAPENRSLVYPAESILSGGVASAPQWNSESRANEYPSSSFSMEIPHLQPAFSAPPYDPLPQSSAAGNLYLAPQNNAGHANCSYYDRCNIYENENGLLDPRTGTGRGTFKRKSPGIPVACESGSISRFYHAGSSSSSSELPLEKPTSDIQNIGLPHYGGGSGLSISGEDSLRNVRSRSRLDLEANPMRTHLSSHSSHNYHATTHSLSSRQAADISNMNAVETTQGRNFNTLPPPAHRRIPTSANYSMSHENNQFLVRGSGTEIGRHYPDSISSRNLVLPSHYLHAPPSRGAREDHATHSQRSMPSYRAGLSHRRFGHEAASAENGLQSPSDTYPSRYLRSSAGGWHHGHRNARSRIAIERFQSISMDAHDRIGSEDLMMMEQSPYYASSRNLLDQYRDMRLDIDSMGYEELLALGERIGSVSTGLSEDMISKCLTETRKSADQNYEEETCCICLEEYTSGEEIGTTKSCGHKYHVSCIRKWLSMKNACPICKAPALMTSLKEE